MAKTKEQKKAMLADYRGRLSSSYGIILVNQNGLEANSVSDFKKKLATVDAQFNTVKNTIFALALKEENLPELELVKSGSHAVVFSSEDIAGAAKMLADFIKEHKEKVVVKSGVLDGQALTIEQVNELANMPTKEQSVAMIAGLLTQSIAATVNVLEDSVRSFVTILDQAFTDQATS